MWCVVQHRGSLDHESGALKEGIDKTIEAAIVTADKTTEVASAAADKTKEVSPPDSAECLIERSCKAFVMVYALSLHAACVRALVQYGQGRVLHKILTSVLAQAAAKAKDAVPKLDLGGSSDSAAKEAKAE